MNPLFIVKAFLSGADMVMMLGCHFGDCHYLKGNYACDMRMTYLKAYLQARDQSRTALLGSNFCVRRDQVRRDNV
jgi:coenzyme F420-reducing hydrogenase delta subunit